jgi:anti-sigma B factor antagonist
MTDLEPLGPGGANDRCPAWRRVMPLEVRKIADGDTVVVRVAGDLDVATAADLWPHLVGSIEAGQVNIVIDCSGVTFLDSSGIAVLVRGLRAVGPVGGSFRLRAVGQRVLEVLTITSLTDVFLDEAELRRATTGR